MKVPSVCAATLLAAANLFAQGTVNLANDYSSAVTNGMTMQLVEAGTNFLVGLYYLPEGEGTPTTETFDASRTVLPPWVGFYAPGVYNGGARTTPESTPAGASCWCQVRVWESSFGASYEEAVRNSMGSALRNGTAFFARRALAGTSNILKVRTATLGLLPTAGSLVEAGLQAMVLVEIPPSELSINDIYVGEGTNGTVNAVFTVSLGASNSLPVTVDYTTADGTAHAGSDYQAVYGTLTFVPGERSKTISIVLTADAAPEPDESFSLNLSNPANAPIADGQATCTITELQISDFSIDAVITFPTAIGHVYAIDKTLSFNPTDWQPLAGSTNDGTGAPVSVVDKGAGQLSQGHYRVRLVQQTNGQ